MRFKTSKPRLKNRLFWQPLLLILVVFGALLLLFNLSVRQLIERQTRSAIQEQFNRLDLLYRSEALKTSSESLISTSYVILDQDFHLLYTSSGLSHQEDDDVAEAITDHVQGEQSLWQGWQTAPTNRTSLSHLEQRSALIEVEDDQYQIRLQKYFGHLNGNYIQQSDIKDAETYYVIAFANVTTVLVWLNQLNKLVAILLVMSAGLLVALLWLSNLNTRRDFWHFTSYLEKIGKRQEGRQLPQFKFKEFEELGLSAQQMDQLISSSQETQKRFFQNVSHELRTPLTSVNGYAEALKSGAVSDVQSASEVIYKESQRMTELVDQLLILSRLESIQDSVQKETFSLNDFLYDLSWRFEQQLQKRHLQLRYQLPESYQEITADETLLERALSNVISNAIRYARTQIVLAYDLTDEQVIIRITNDGEPISDEDKEHLFERFYTGKSGQFGIGLAMTKAIITQHSGRIWVESSDQETCFIIALPIHSA